MYVDEIEPICQFFQHFTSIFFMQKCLRSFYVLIVRVLSILENGSWHNSYSFNVGEIDCSCHGAFWHGRSVLERVILSLLVILLVSVFLVGGLVLVQLGTGHLISGGNFAFSGKSGKSFVSDQSTGEDPSDSGRLFRDDGVEIVRIKTTEEVGRSFKVD